MVNIVNSQYGLSIATSPGMHLPRSLPESQARHSNGTSQVSTHLWLKGT